MVKCMVMDGNKSFGGEYGIVYTEIKIQCCTYETYNVMNQCYLNSKDKTEERKEFLF